MSSPSPFAAVWTLLDNQVGSGRFPGYAAAIRHRGRAETHTGGKLAVGGETAMQPDTVFRIASLSKLVGGALTLSLIQDGAFQLEDPVAEWLPELADPRVLSHPDAEIDDTVAVNRQIVVRDLLTFTFGLGMVLHDSPIRRVMHDLGIATDAATSPPSAEIFMAKVAQVPLVCQPGERWLYHTGSDLLGVLIARAMGRPLHVVLAQRITGPLGMASTGFFAQDATRLASLYQPGPAGLEAAADSDDALTAPLFESLGAGLVSTVEDYGRFLDAMTTPGPVIADKTVKLMTADSLNDAQRQGEQEIMGPGTSWGMGTGIDIEQVNPWMTPGRFGWNGGSGTTAAVDLANGVTAILFTQRAMMSATGDFDDFWRTLYSCL